MYFNFSNPWMIFLLVILVVENLSYLSTPGSIISSSIIYTRNFNSDYISWICTCMGCR